MTHTINTLHDFMLRTEGITYILIVVALVGFVFFWRFLTDRDEDGRAAWRRSSRGASSLKEGSAKYAVGFRVHRNVFWIFCFELRALSSHRSRPCTNS